MTDLLRRPVSALAAVVVVLGAALVVDELRPVRPAVARAAVAHRLPVDSADLVCPPAPSSAHARSRLTVARPSVDPDVAPAPAGRPQLSVRPVNVGSAGPPALLPGEGQSAAMPLTGVPGALEVVAAGAAAPGLEATEVTRGGAGALRGLAGSGCAPAATDFWFVGGEAPVGESTTVYLTNPTDAAAVADVDVYGPAGQVDSPTTRGITVRARSVRQVRIDGVAPAATRLATHVVVTTGRLAAAMLVDVVSGLNPLGLDWVAPAVAPATSLVVPGVVGGVGGRTLRLVAPGAAATVRLRLSTSDGLFSPAGIQTVSVPAGSVVDVDLTSAARGQDLGVVVDSDAPVTATERTTVISATTGVGEISYVPAAPPVGRLATVADNAVGGLSAAATLLLTAPTGGVAATVVYLTAAGAPAKAATPLSVTGGQTMRVPLPALGGNGVYGVAVQTPAGSAPLYVARVLSEAGTRGPLFTEQPLLPAPLSVEVPVTASDLSAGLPPR